MYLIEVTKQSFSSSFLFHKANLFQKDFTVDSYKFALKLLIFVLIIHLCFFFTFLNLVCQPWSSTFTTLRTALKPLTIIQLC